MWPTGDIARNVSYVYYMMSTIRLSVLSIETMLCKDTNILVERSIIDMSKKSKSGKKFRRTWCNQTRLGEKFGLTAIEVGKILVAHGLKDVITGLATREAVTEGYAKLTPIQGGTPFYMWSRNKVTKLLLKSHKPIS